jgi:hypothetical protein
MIDGTTYTRQQLDNAYLGNGSTVQCEGLLSTEEYLRCLANLRRRDESLRIGRNVVIFGLCLMAFLIGVVIAQAW